MSETARLVTAEELAKLPDDDHRYELVEGRLIRMSPVGFDHGRVVSNVIFLLKQYLEDRDLGVVVTEVGFKLASNPDTVRAPDVAFVRRNRVPRGRSRGFLQGAPDLAVEVVSPEDRPTEMRAKVDEYLVHGVPLVLVIDPDTRTISAHRRLTPPVVASIDDDVIDFGDVIPGLRCKLREIFEP